MKIHKACINLHHAIDSFRDSGLSLSLNKLAFLSCAVVRPRGTASISRMMGVTQAYASVTMESLRRDKLVVREDKFAGLYHISEMGQWVLRETEKALKGKLLYEPTRKKKPLQRDEEELPATSEMLPLSGPGFTKEYGPPPPVWTIS